MVLRDQIWTQWLPDAQRVKNIESLQHPGIKIGLAVFLDIVLIFCVAADIDPEQRPDFIQIALQRSLRNFYRFIKKAKLVIEILVDLIEGGMLEISELLNDEGVAEEGVAFSHCGYDR
jgi:hypothetical protein